MSEACLFSLVILRDLNILGLYAVDTCFYLHMAERTASKWSTILRIAPMPFSVILIQINFTEAQAPAKKEKVKKTVPKRQGSTAARAMTSKLLGATKPLHSS